MADDNNDRRLWSSFATALGTELRDGTSIMGASGLNHPLQAMCVDDKNSRIVLVSAEPNPRVAALIQGDVQQTLPEAKVIVARPTVLDLGAAVRSLFANASSAQVSLPQLASLTEDYNKLSKKKQAAYINKPSLSTVLAMANAVKNVPMPVLSHVGSLVQQATHIDWMQVFEALRTPGNAGGVSLSQLYQYDGSAVDREYGVCPLPLYEFREADWELFLSGSRPEEVRERLKALNIFQYFYPPADQLVVGLAERGIVDRKAITEIVESAPAQGHPLGQNELIPSARSIHELVDLLAEDHFVTEIDNTVKVTSQGTTARLKIKASPREGALSKFIARFKFSVNIRVSTKDLSGL